MKEAHARGCKGCTCTWCRVGRRPMSHVGWKRAGDKPPCRAHWVTCGRRRARDTTTSSCAASLLVWPQRGVQGMDRQAGRAHLLDNRGLSLPHSRVRPARCQDEGAKNLEYGACEALSNLNNRHRHRHRRNHHYRLGVTRHAWEFSSRVEPVRRSREFKSCSGLTPTQRARRTVGANLPRRNPARTRRENYTVIME